MHAVGSPQLREYFAQHCRRLAAEAGNKLPAGEAAAVRESLTIAGLYLARGKFFLLKHALNEVVRRSMGVRQHSETRRTYESMRKALLGLSHEAGAYADDGELREFSLFLVKMAGLLAIDPLRKTPGKSAPGEAVRYVTYLEYQHECLQATHAILEQTVAMPTRSRAA